MRPLIIGIAGGTGSGKTTLVENLKEQFGADISVLPHDNYYAAHHDMSLASLIWHRKAGSSSCRGPWTPGRCG